MVDEVAGKLAGLSYSKGCGQRVVDDVQLMASYK